MVDVENLNVEVAPLVKPIVINNVPRNTHFI